ncbi:MAG TPA: hypothetical protein VJM32_06345 [Candidatus Saccharimonadales bacterium]|nr:hypothetical protein [Candidatus Saccharimonadales bacterium]
MTPAPASEQRDSILALVDYVFTQGEPLPWELAELRGNLPDAFRSLASLFLNVRLTLRWRGFGVSHSGVEVRPGASAEAITLAIRVYDPQEMRPVLERAFGHAGFMNIMYADQPGAMGGYLHVTATPQLIQNIRS